MISGAHLTALQAVLATLLVFPATSNAEDRSDVKKEQLSSSGKYLPNRSGQEKKAKEAKAVSPNVDPVVKALGGGRYQVGEVVLDKKTRSVHIPAQVNMTEGVVEYILVSNEGKVHESVLSTKARPSDIHVACLLLGMKGVPVTKWPKDYLHVAKANQVSVEIAWKSNGPNKTLPAEQCVLRTDSHRVGTGGEGGLASGHWLYSGSNERGGVFAAQSEGSVISIIADDAALVNGLRPRNQEDTLYAANGKVLPNKNFKVEVIFKLPEPN